MGHDLCECGLRPATYHEVVKINGEVHERHLCAQCAAERGLAPAQPTSVPEILEQLTGDAGPTLVASSRGAKARRAEGCQACGLTFAEFKKTGQLGCPECYEVFGPKLAPLVERWHQGGDRHVGKAPRRALEASRSGDARAMENVLGDARERAARLRLLQDQLDAAIHGEHFERAAQLRDEVQRLAAGGPMPGAADRSDDETA